MMRNLKELSWLGQFSSRLLLSFLSKNKPFIIMNKPIVFFDLETTGVDTTKDKIVEIALVKYLDGVEIDSFHRTVNPLIPIPKEASGVHGISDEDVKNAPSFKEISKEVSDFMHVKVDGDLVICDIGGFNSNAFDIPLLCREMEDVGLPINLNDANFIDVGVLYKILNPRTLSAAVEEYLGKGHEDAHTALADTQATFSVFEEMVKRYPELQSLDMKGLSLLCNYDKERADIDRKFYIKEGEYYFNFGKHKDQLASSNIAYLDWMIGGSFSSSTKSICHKIIQNAKS